ncbi:hypothetical protein QEV83_17125 [Methylocapsa sp. D3K7]|uniref:hypothetical protein n=1 Tax=Methylocapsa sp. D3K7 TaxID=3041435 RepID=UPI00244EC16E|nr:hypothetical protein [Methylocapsa sp. D3K7]WGJ14343.1 hypothetical protein QEV83_17125 [Methylocapsa sp. D3K7]
MFLSDEIRHPASLDEKIVYSADLKLSKANVRYASADARTTGEVLGQALSGFSFLATPPSGSFKMSVLLQISHSTSSPFKGPYLACQTDNEGRVFSIVYGQELPGSPLLPFVTDDGELHHLEFTLNDYLCDLVKHRLSCRDPSGSSRQLNFPDEALNFTNWHVQGIYIGFEVNDTDLRAGTSTPGKVGAIEMGMQIANPKLIHQNGQPYDSSSCHR